jgi:hypothetical protein
VLCAGFEYKIRLGRAGGGGGGGGGGLGGRSKRGPSCLHVYGIWAVRFAGTGVCTCDEGHTDGRWPMQRATLEAGEERRGKTEAGGPSCAVPRGNGEPVQGRPTPRFWSPATGRGGGGGGREGEVDLEAGLNGALRASCLHVYGWCASPAPASAPATRGTPMQAANLPPRPTPSPHQCGRSPPTCRPPRREALNSTASQRAVQSWVVGDSTTILELLPPLLANYHYRRRRRYAIQIYSTSI